VPPPPRIVLLLPPSEGKAEGGAGRGRGARPWSPATGTFGAALGDRRAAVARALAACGGGDEHLLGVRGSTLERARAANTSLEGAPTMPAWRRYTGVVWDHLDVETLPAEARRRASRSVAVLSGLLGAASLEDPVPDHRLKLGASLPPLGKLSTWWRDDLSAALDAWIGRRFVVDLLPAEHRAAWRPGPRMSGVSVGFVERDGKVAGHDAKAAKGRLARHLLVSQDPPLDALGAWHDARFTLTLTPLRGSCT